MKQHKFTKNSAASFLPPAKKEALLSSKPGCKKIQLKTPLASALIIALLTGCGIFITGCGAAGAAFPQTKSTSMIAETTAAAMDITVDNGFTADTAAVTQENIFINDEAESPEASAEMGAASLTSSNPIQPVSTSRKLIRTVELYVETTDFDQLISDISQNVTDTGGYIEQSDISGSSLSTGTGRCFAHFTAHVPSNKLDGFIAQVSQQGNVTNKSEYTQDVTLQYSDIESRKKSLTIEQERLWALLEKADTLESVIALEKRLSEIRYQLESFESQLRTYDNQVDYSTISLSINEVQVLTPTTPDTIKDRIEKGFRRNLETISRTSINLIVWFLSSLPTLLILALVILVLVFIGRKLNPASGNKLWKHTRKFRNTAASADTSVHSSQADITENSAMEDRSDEQK